MDYLTNIMAHCLGIDHPRILCINFADLISTFFVSLLLSFSLQS